MHDHTFNTSLLCGWVAQKTCRTFYTKKSSDMPRLCPRMGVLILRLLLHSTLRQSPFVHRVSGTSSLPNHLEQMLYPSIFKYIPCRMLYLCQMNLKKLYLKTFKNHKYFIPKREGTTLTKWQMRSPQLTERYLWGLYRTSRKHGVLTKQPTHTSFLCTSHASEIMEKKEELGGLYPAVTSLVYYDVKLIFLEQTQQWENITPANFQKILLE